MNDLSFIGRFHPLLVHLPIGFVILLIGALFLSKQIPTRWIQQGMFWSTLVALLSCLTGTLLYTGEGYTWATIESHLISGWTTTVISGLLTFNLWKTKSHTQWSSRVLALVLLISLTLTGHWGGNLTHGETYLTENLPDSFPDWLKDEPKRSSSWNLHEDNWEDTLLFAGAIAPILEENCRSCHNPKNAKGELDMTTWENLLKGGKNGPALMAGHPDKSQILQRMLLPMDHEEHMPPREKKQPKKEEVELIRLWLTSDKPLEVTPRQAKITLATIQPLLISQAKAIYPEVDLAPISEDKLKEIRQSGFFVEKISQESPLLHVSCVNKPTFSAQDQALLNPIVSHIAFLDLARTSIGDEVWNWIEKMPHLTVLNLRQTKITGKGIPKNSTLTFLKRLNCTSTPLTGEGLQGLSHYTSLEKVYVGQTPAASQNPAERKYPFRVDWGQVSLPTLPSDEVMY